MNNEPEFSDQTLEDFDKAMKLKLLTEIRKAQDRVEIAKKRIENIRECIGDNFPIFGDIE